MSAQDILFASNDPFVFGGLIDFRDGKVIISELEAESTNIQNLVTQEFIISDAAIDVMEANTGTILVFGANTGIILDFHSNLISSVGINSNTGAFTDLNATSSAFVNSNITDTNINRATVDAVILHGAVPPTPVSNKMYAIGEDILWSGAILGVPIGTVLPFAAVTPPVGYLECDGTIYLTSLYPKLFAVIGYSFGGAGLVFNVPDARGRTIAGIETSTTRLTSPVDGTILGDTGGNESSTLAVSNLPIHSHSISLTTDDGGEHTHLIAFDGTANAGPNATRTLNTQDTGATYDLRGSNDAHDSFITNEAGTHTHNISGTTGVTGSGNSFSNIQPTIIMSFIIKAF